MKQRSDLGRPLKNILSQRRFQFLVILFPLFLSLPAAYAQIYTSNIVGTATDPSGAVMPGVKMSLLNVQTGVVKKTQTNSAGNYVFQYLHPGSYTLTAEATGFKKFVRENITLQMYSKLSINVTLHPGAVTQSVTVRGATPLLQTQTGEQSITMGNEQITDLPLIRSDTTSYDILDQVKLLSPGVVMDTSETWTVSEGGIYRRDQDYIDGALTTQAVYEGNAINPSPDAIQEIKVMTNSFSAVYGTTGGSITIATTKSGTNQFHGDVYEYVQNDRFNAGDPFEHTVPKEVYNQPGFTVGGPILKNKLFFFFDAQWTRDNTEQAYPNLTVPDPSWRSGDFQNVEGAQVGTDDLGRPIYQNEIFNYATQRSVTAGQVDPVTGLVATATGTVRDPFPNNTIPTADLNPAALKLQALFPNPTTNSIYQNYSVVPVAFFHEHLWDLKVNYVASDRDQIMGRWSSIYDDGYLGAPTVNPFPGLGGGGLAPAVETGQNPVLDWVHTFGPSTTNDLHASYFHVYCYRVPVGYGSVGLATYGIEGLPNASALLGVPNIGFTGSSGVNFLGSRYDTLELQGQADISVDDLVSLVRGKHTIQFGGEVQRMQINNLQPNPSNTRWYFSNDFTNQYSGTGVGSTGFDYASFLTGLPDNLSYKYFPNFADVRASVFALFAQDDFRVKQNLTLNIGLRWDAPLNWYPVNNTVGAIYTWNGTTTTFETLGQNGFRNTKWNNNWWNWGPRFGLAWSPSRLHNTVIRGGYGVFSMGNQQGGAQGGQFALSPLWYTVYDNGVYNAASINNSLKPLTTLSSIPYAPPVIALNPNPGIVPDNNPMPTAQQWNIGVQHEIPGQIMFNVAYAGSHDYYLPQNGYSINTIPLNLLATCKGQNIAGCAPYPNYSLGALGLGVSLGENSYNSLQITATKHFSQGLSFLMGYTWEKNLNVGENGFRDPVADRYLDRAWDSNSVPQAFTLSFVYALPFGPGRHWLTHGPAVPFLGGWQLSDVTDLQSGYPLYASTGFNSCACGAANQPNRIGNPLPSGFVQNTSHWFNSAAFTEPALYTMGNAGYSGQFFGPAMSSFDISIGKHFYFPKLGESKNLEFRADFFNAFNTPWFSSPTTNIQSGTVGEIGSANSTPRYIQLGMKFSF